MLSCFKAYDVRGRIPDELDETLAYQIGQAYAAFVKPQQSRGRARHPRIEQAVAAGAHDAG